MNTPDGESGSRLKIEHLTIVVDRFPFGRRGYDKEINGWVSEELDVVEAFLTMPRFPPYGGLKVVGAVYADGWAVLGFCYGQYEHAIFLASAVNQMRKERGESFPLAERIDYGGGDVSRGSRSVNSLSDSLDNRPLPELLQEKASNYLLEREAVLQPPNSQIDWECADRSERG